VTESKFRERRSAHRDETETVSPSPAPEARPPKLEPERPPEPEPEPEVAPAEVEEGGLPGADLDQLAGMDVPPATFLELVEPHIEMALRFLGQLPLTPEGERRVLPLWAKREIDLLGILEERTRGNLPPDERQALDQALDQLRMLYLKATP
jgi:hypothetical protein